MLDDRGVAGRCAVGVEAGAAPGSTLAKEVPTLVELDLEVLQAAGVVGAEPVAAGGVLETVLLLHEVVDPGEQVLIIHAVEGSAPSFRRLRRR